MGMEFLHFLSQCWPVKRFVHCFQWFIAQLCRKGIQHDQMPELLDITTQLTKRQEQNSQIMNEAIRPANGGNPGFKRFFHRLLGMKAEYLIIYRFRRYHEIHGFHVF